MSDQRVRTLVAIDSGVGGDFVERVVDDPRISVAAVGDPARGWPRHERPDALMVVCRDGSDQAISLVRRARADYHERPVVVVCEGSPNGFLDRAFAAGAEDVVAVLNPDLAAGDTYLALAKAVARRGAEAPTTFGRLVTVLGPKGGTGKTLVTTNLAVALAMNGERAIIVDLDLQFGDVGLALSARPERTIYDLAQAADPPDAAKLEGYLSEHSSGAAALLAPARPDQASAVTPDLVRQVVGVLRTMAPFVIVDTPPSFTPEVIAALDESSDVVLVAMLDALSLKNTKIALETLRLMGIAAPVRIVLNRSDTSVGISHTDVVSILGRAPDVLLPSSRAVVRAVNAGDPIVQSSRRHESAKALHALAGLYLDGGR
jgi:pilus assembly protein CpaE